MLIQGFLDGLRPIKRITVSEWADNNRILSTESSAEAGKWNTARTPYLKQIMDDLSPTSPIKKVVVGKGAQLGFTESGVNAIGCYMDTCPCPMMYIMPTVDMAKVVAKLRIDPMIEKCPTLQRKVPNKLAREGGNTNFEKAFPGGVLMMSGANSAASLSSRSVRVMIMDEVDRFPEDLDGEGSPIGLAEARTSTFGDSSKQYMLSTPTLEHSSVIQKELDATDVNKYYVPCPYCGAMQELLFKQLVWTEDNYEDVQYRCIHCNELIEERHKPRMLGNGEWVATRPENKSLYVRGYHINSLYSPLGWLSWRDIVKKYDAAVKEKNAAKMKVFVNTILGETFKEEGEAPDWQTLYDRREDYKIDVVPEEVGFLTCGVDIQRDRIELEVVGWCENLRTYSITYRVLLGDTSGKNVWNELAAVVDEKFECEGGGSMPITMMCIDSGYNTTEVYNFCKRYDISRVVPTKGSDTQNVIISTPRPIMVGKTGKAIPNLKLWTVGVSKLKEELYGWLRQRIDPEDGVPRGYCHFPMYNTNHFKGLTAEKLQWRENKGYRKPEWVKIYERNEQLDCRIYARAAAAIVGIDRFTSEYWQQLRESRSPQDVEVAKPKRRSTFMDNWRNR